MAHAVHRPNFLPNDAFVLQANHLGIKIVRKLHTGVTTLIVDAAADEAAAGDTTS